MTQTKWLIHQKSLKKTKLRALKQTLLQSLLRLFDVSKRIWRGCEQRLKTTVVRIEGRIVGSGAEPRVLALDVMGWMDAVLGERCSCASPLSISLFSVIIDKEMVRVVQQTKNVPQTVSVS